MTPVHAAHIARHHIVDVMGRLGGVTLEELAETLASVPAFSVLSKEARTKVASIALLRRFGTNEVVCRQGGDANVILVIRCACVRGVGWDWGGEAAHRLPARPSLAPPPALPASSDPRTLPLPTLIGTLATAPATRAWCARWRGCRRSAG